MTTTNELPIIHIKTSDEPFTRPLLWPHNEGWCASINHKIFRFDPLYEWFRPRRVRIYQVNASNEIIIPALFKGYTINLDSWSFLVSLKKEPRRFTPAIHVELVEPSQ